MDTKEFGAFLKELRKEKGYTQEELAEKLFVSNKTISRWERGINMPDIEMLIFLSNLYEVKIGDLLEGKNLNETENEKITDEQILVEKVSNYSRVKIGFERTKKFITIVLVALSLIIVSYISYQFIYKVTGGGLFVIIILAAYIAQLLDLHYKRKIMHYDVYFPLSIFAIGVIVSGLLLSKDCFPNGEYVNLGLFGGYMI